MSNFKKAIERNKQYNAYIENVAEIYNVDLEVLKEVCWNLFVYTKEPKLDILKKVEKKLEDGLTNEGLEQLRERIDKLFD